MADFNIWAQSTKGKKRKQEQNLFGGDFGIDSNSSKQSNPRKKAPNHLKPAVRNRWWGTNTLKGECFCCERELHYDLAEMGHIQAHSKGGSMSPENLRLICSICNKGMRNKNMKIYMKETYPERYNKLFPKEIENSDNKPEKKKSKPKKKRKNGLFGGGNLFGVPPKRSKNNHFGL